MKQAPKFIVLQMLRGYQAAISPWVRTVCRFQPTCSEYAMRAVEVHGVVRGGAMAVARLLRCHPFGGRGYDPVQLPQEMTEL